MQQPNDYALVIGINRYPNYKDLQGAVSDAEQFSAWLTDEVAGGGLPKAPAPNCQLLINPAAPIGAEIDAALDLIFAAVELARAQQAQPPRRFYLYFSGHGQANMADEVNLCLSQWSVKNKSRVALSANQCWNAVISCMGFSEVAVFLDCCRVRLASAAGMPPGLFCPVPLAAAGTSRMFKAYSSEFLSQSFEGARIPAAGAAPVNTNVEEDEAVYSGYFTHALLSGLKGAAADQPAGGVSQMALKSYLEMEVPRLAFADGRVQKPRVPETDLPSDAVFGSALPVGKNAFAVTIQFQPGRSGALVLVQPDGTELVCPDSSQPWCLHLPKGLYMLSDPGSSPSVEKPFRVPDVQNVRF